MVSQNGLAKALSQLATFTNANVNLEQYPTTGDVAAHLLWHARMRGDLEDKDVVDLGAGTGILAIGAALLGAKSVLAIEKDPAAANVLQANKDVYEGCDTITVRVDDVENVDEKADLVVMNPPFGTRRAHADRLFLEKAVAIAPVIYTMHKTSTDKFVKSFATDAGYNVTWKEETTMPLQHSMKHHTRERSETAVTLYALEKK